MRLSLELVPRDLRSLADQLSELRDLGRVDTVNVPDLAQFETRGWQAAVETRRAGPWCAVPHIRAREVLRDAEAGWPALASLQAAGVDEVLIVTGDAAAGAAPGGDPAPGGPDLCIAALRALRASHPEVRAYAALDPYRAGFADELAYVERKLDAGAAGLFTQPFFDLRLLSVWQELTAGVEVFWGVTSVTSARSQRYWLSRNRAVFPTGFEPTLAWHKALAARALDHVGGTSGHVYFMPIRVGIGDWLGDLLA